MKKTKIIIFDFLLVFSILLFCSCNPNDTEIEEEENYEKGMIKPYYASDELIYADYVIEGSGVDPTGQKDSTEAIQNYLNRCANAGGGTVYLPRGKYKISSNISIPSFVYLKGDYNDPDLAGFNGDYGTILVADVAPAQEKPRSQYLADKNDKYNNFPAFITVGGSAGLNGVTVYYPNQNSDNIIPYPFTIEIPSFAGIGGSINHMAYTIKNITLINSYKGICASVTPSSDGKSAANELLHLENIKGTVLYQGMQLYNASETGVVRDITFSNMYWFSASGSYQGGNLDKMDAFTKRYGIGMLLGDLEWDTFTNISLSSYKIGIRIHDGLRRYIAGQPEIYFIGQLYNPNITDCITGLRVDNLFMNMGINIAGGIIEGSTYSINDSYEGTSKIKVVGTKLIGDVRGTHVYRSGGEDIFTIFKNEDLLPDSTAPVVHKVQNVAIDATQQYNIDKTAPINDDAAVKIQQSIDECYSNGGGVVYLKAGFYRIKTPLTLKDGVELRGSASQNTRDQNGMSKGTVFLVEHGLSSGSNNKTDKATITIKGDNAGVSGIRFIYPKNPPLLNNVVSVNPYAYTIRAKGNNNYVKYCSFVGVYNGIEFAGDKQMNNGIILGINGTFYSAGINIVNVKNMKIEEALSNAAVLARHNYKSIFPTEFSKGWVVDGPLMTKVYDEITRPNSIFISVKDSSCNIANSFTFASFGVVNAVNSDIVVYNVAGDNLYTTGYLFKIDGGSLLGVNIMRFQGLRLLSTNGANVTLLNRLSLHNNNDTDVVNGEEKSPQLIKGADSNINDLPEVYIYKII